MRKAVKSVAKLFFNDLKFRYKFSLAYLVIIIVPMALFLHFINKTAEETLNTQIMKTVVQSFEQTALSVERLLGQYNNMSYSISRHELFSRMNSINPESYPHTRQMLDKYALDRAIFSFDNSAQRSDIKIYFQDFPFFVDNKTYFNLDSAKDEKWYVSIREYFLSHRISLMLIPPHDLPENEGNGEQIASLVRVIIDQNYYGNYIAMLRVDFPMDYFYEILSKNNIYEESLTYLQSVNGDIIAVTGEGLFEEYQASQLSSHAGRAAGWSKISLNEKTFLYSRTPIENYRCDLVALIPYEQFMSPINNVKDTNNMLIIVLSTIALAFALTISFSMTRRLSVVVGKMNNAQSGDLEPISDSAGRDEVGCLVESYNYMIEEMKHLIKIQYENGKEIKNAELNALQAQINPHFLYNTLDMINWFAANGMVDEIRDVVVALAKFYKLSLSNGLEEISIKDELMHVSMYTQIQCLRYKGQLQFEISVDNEICSCLVIKTILQPVVENAIMHGIMMRDDKIGKVKISACDTGDSIILSVCDDGVGMTGAQIQAALNGTSKNGKRGYGIFNVNKRIKFFYGDDYGIAYSSKVNEGVCVKINIPKREGMSVL